MGKVFDNVLVDVPHGAIVSRYDNRVFLNHSKTYNPSSRSYNYGRTMIGMYAGKNQMHPNENYISLYPAMWEEITGQKPPRGFLKIGLRACIDRYCRDDGIKEILYNIFGDSKSNALLDYALFMIAMHSNSTEQIESFLEEVATFSKAPLSDSAYSKLFSKEMDAALITKFKEEWIRHCAENGIDEVYLCIDGSNDDCASNQEERTEKGHPKSRKKDADIVGFMYVVSAKDGTPVTYWDYRGGEVDSKAIKEVLSVLLDAGMHVRGAIIDKGFCTLSVENCLRENAIPYVMMLINGTHGVEEMMKMYTHALPWNVVNFIPGPNYFGASGEFPIFKDSTENSWIHLYFDWKNGGDRAVTLLNKAFKALASAQKDAGEGKRPSASRYVLVQEKTDPETGSRIYTATLNAEVLQREVDRKGFSAIATTEKMTATEANNLYDLRNNSEVCYRYLKSELGMNCFRTYKTSSVRSKLFLGFLASIIRNKIVLAAKQVGLDTNVILNEMSLLEMRLYSGNCYVVVHTENERQRRFLSVMKVTEDDLDDVADEKNAAMHGGNVKYQRKKKPGPKRGSHHHKYDENGNPIPNKPGPKPGSHHKTTQNPDGTRMKKDGTPAKKPGPKPGSHHARKPADNASGAGTGTKKATAEQAAKTDISQSAADTASADAEKMEAASSVQTAETSSEMPTAPASAGAEVKKDAGEKPTAKSSGGTRLKKDGTPAKKPGPKPGSHHAHHEAADASGAGTGTKKATAEQAAKTDISQPAADTASPASADAAKVEAASPVQTAETSSEMPTAPASTGAEVKEDAGEKPAAKSSGRTRLKKDGTPARKPGPKPGSHHAHKHAEDNTKGS